MKRIRPIAGRNKKIVAILISLLVLCLLLPLEYDNIKAKTFIYPILWIGVVYTIRKLFPNDSILRNSLLVLLYIVGCFYFLTQVTGFCGWAKHGTLYINKRDRSIRVTCRTYDCLGTAEGCQLFEERRLTKHLRWVTRFSKEPVDTTQWQNVPFMSADYEEE